jgi:rare lipoprotein A
MAVQSGRLPLGLLLPLLLTGCGFSFRPAPSPPPVAVDQVPNAVPRVEPRSKYGNPDSYVAEGRRYYVLKSADGFVERGIASWYGPDFHGKRTSSGEIYDMYQMTAAHKTLPIPAYVEVTNLQTGQRAVVKVNDRGPFKDNRIIDLSYVAARKLGIWAQGTGLVEIRTLIPGAAPALATTTAAITPAPAPAIKAPDKNPGAPVPFYIQVGAFIDRGNADRLRARVQTVAPNVQISPGESNGQAIYRVQIGPLTDVDTSDRIVHSLLQAGVNEYRIVLE